MVGINKIDICFSSGVMVVEIKGLIMWKVNKVFSSKNNLIRVLGSIKLKWVERKILE